MLVSRSPEHSEGEAKHPPVLSSLPLSRYRVVDFGAAWAAPMASQFLADMGAQVIKIESQARMDGLRLGRPIVGEDVAGGDKGKWPELQPVFHGLNRNKLSVTLNLKASEAVALAKDLILQSDVVLNNYAPAVMDRLGLGYPALRALRPDLVFVSMPAAGESGPLSDVVAYAPIVLALSGLMAMIGYEDGKLVGELQSAWSDAVAALHAAMAAVAALRHRNLTGQGQHVEVSQWEATTSWLGEAVMDWTMNKRQRSPEGNLHPTHAPHGNYRCAGDDKWVSIAVCSDEEWQGMCKAATEDTAAKGETPPPWTKDPFYVAEPRRVRYRKDLDRAIEEWTAQRTPEEVTQLLQRHGVAAFPVMNIEDQFLDPHFRARQAWVETEHPMVGAEWLYGQAWDLTATPGGIRRHAPLLGEHNREILGVLLGVPEAALDTLVQRQVVW